MQSGPEMQRPDVLSEAHPEPLLAAMTEEHWEAARLSAAVAEAAQDARREAAKAPDEPLAAVAEAAQDVPREAVEVPDEPLAVVAEAAQDVPREAAKAPDEPLAVAAEAAQDVPREAAEVPDEPLAVAAEAAQDAPREAAEVPDEPLAVVVEAAQDVPREAAEARDEPLAAALPSAAEPSVAPQALSLLAARLARQRTTLPLRGPEVMTFEGPRPQSLRAGSIEFVSWRPVRKKNPRERFVYNDQLITVRRQCGEARGPRPILLNATELLIRE